MIPKKLEDILASCNIETCSKQKYSWVVTKNYMS